MIIYNNTSLAFREDVDSNRIADIVETKFVEKLGHRESPNEKTAWRNSLHYMETVIRNANVADDCGVLIEYVIPNTSNRVDFMITGEDQQGNENYVLIELKQWENAETTEIPDVVRTYLGGGIRNTTHPSYQADSYNRMLQNMNQAIYENHISGHACAYLHNYSQHSPEPLLDKRYDDVTKAAPIYFIDDYRKLEDYIREMVGCGKGMPILYEIANGRIRPSKKLVDCVDSLYKGNDDFVLLDEQNVAYQTIVNQLSDLSTKRTIIVKGGPGTGKSVISFKVLHQLIDRRLNAKFVAPNEAFREVMIEKLVSSKADKKKNIKPLFGGSGTFYDCPKNVYDVLVVDEAHRLKGQGAYMYRGTNQVRDIIHASILNVFFVDDTQRVRPDDIGTVDEIKKQAAAEGSEVYEMELKTQYRCAGAEGFVNWVTHTLQIEDTANYDGWEKEAFEFGLYENPIDLYQKILEKNADGKEARLVAGFAWDWSKDQNAEVDDVTIPEWNFSLPWNARNQRAYYAIKDDSVNQVGCIHTVQGLEFDYVGVIIGDDLRYNPVTHELYGDYDNYKDKSGKKGLKNQQARLTAYIKNIYKVLMSRGTSGCYIYCRDPQVQRYFEERLRLIHYAEAIHKLQHKDQ